MKGSLNPLALYTDEELISSLQSNDEKAFTIIYNTYYEVLYAVAYKYIKDRETAKDATQQIFLKLWEARAILSIQISLKNYLYTMMKNYILNEIRNNYTALEKNYELAQETGDFEDNLLARLEEKQIAEQLYSGIDKLPEQKRIICLYKIRDGLSNQEIADKMGITIPTVKTHYSQAIKLLRKHMEKVIILILFSFLS